MQEDRAPAEDPQTSEQEAEKDTLLEEMALLLHVAIQEWPRQIGGTQWEAQARAILTR